MVVHKNHEVNIDLDNKSIEYCNDNLLDQVVEQTPLVFFDTSHEI